MGLAPNNTDLLAWEIVIIQCQKLLFLYYFFSIAWLYSKPYITIYSVNCECVNWGKAQQITAYLCGYSDVKKATVSLTGNCCLCFVKSIILRGIFYDCTSVKLRTSRTRLIPESPIETLNSSYIFCII